MKAWSSSGPLGKFQRSTIPERPSVAQKREKLSKWGFERKHVTKFKKKIKVECQTIYCDISWRDEDKFMINRINSRLADLFFATRGQCCSMTEDSASLRHEGRHQVQINDGQIQLQCWESLKSITWFQSDNRHIYHYNTLWQRREISVNHKRISVHETLTISVHFILS